MPTRASSGPWSAISTGDLTALRQQMEISPDPDGVQPDYLAPDGALATERLAVCATCDRYRVYRNTIEHGEQFECMGQWPDLEQGDRTVDIRASQPLAQCPLGKWESTGIGRLDISAVVAAGVTVYDETTDTLHTA